jgi:PAS domain S-box-containing protein
MRIDTLQSAPTGIPATLRLGALLWAALMLLLSLGGWLLYHNASRELIRDTQASQQAILREGRTILLHRLSMPERDVRFMADNLFLRQFLDTPTPERRRLVESFFIDLMSTRLHLYDQMRYLDEAGREVIRINNGEGTARALPETGLQDKSGRYYFSNTRSLAAGQIYLSPLDLNVEQGVVEQPPKPMLRYATPAVDGQGERRGVMVLNYLGQHLLERLRGAGAPLGIDFWLINQDGDWLIGPDPHQEWGFMFPERANAGFAQRYPEVWQPLQQQGDGPLFVTAANQDLLTLSRFNLSADMPGNAGRVQTDPGMQWYLVAGLPHARLAVLRAELRHPLLIAWGLLAVLFAALSAWVAVLLRRRQLALAEIEQRERQFHALLEAAPDAIVVSDGDGRIVMANAQVEALFAIPRSEVQGRRLETLLPERFRDAHVGNRGRYLDSPSLRPMGEGRDLLAVRGDGSEFPVSVTLSTLGTPTGTLVISAIRDITESHRSTAALDAANSRLREAVAQVARSNHALKSSNKELESFSYSVSHDLRAPLRAIDGFSRILIKTHADALDDKGRDLLERMAAAARRMGGLIDDMLKLSRISRGELKRETVDLSALAAATARQLGEAFPEHPVEVVIQPGLRAEADPNLVRLVLDNLFGNAWKFTGNTAHPRVEFGCEHKEGQAVFFVRDNGAGFDMEYAAKLFGAFQRLHTEHEFPGTGIGLATVMRAIHKHGGDVAGEGAVGRGALFRFTLDEGDNLT